MHKTDYFLITLAVVVVFFITAMFASLQSAAEAAQETTTATTAEETTEAVTEPTETEVPTEAPTEPVEVTLYDVPLSEDLQFHIIKQAEAHGIDPAIVFAMAWKESTYNPNAIGDGGNSYGLLQIQPRWHSTRMQKLGCTDLLNPYQNVVVGIDYLAENLSRYGSIEAALTAYNRGHYPGYVTGYAHDVMAKAERLVNVNEILQ